MSRLSHALIAILFSLTIFAEEPVKSDEGEKAKNAQQVKAIEIAKSEAERRKYSQQKGFHWEYQVKKTEAGWLVTICLTSDDRKSVVPGEAKVSIDDKWIVTHYEVGH